MKKEIICNKAARDLDAALTRLKSSKTAKTEALVNLMHAAETAINELEYISSQNEALAKLISVLRA